MSYDTVYAGALQELVTGQHYYEKVIGDKGWVEGAFLHFLSASENVEYQFAG